MITQKDKVLLIIKQKGDCNYPLFCSCDNCLLSVYDCTDLSLELRLMYIIKEGLKQNIITEQDLFEEML